MRLLLVEDREKGVESFYIEGFFCRTLEAKQRIGRRPPALFEIKAIAKNQWS